MREISEREMMALAQSAGYGRLGTDEQPRSALSRGALDRGPPTRTGDRAPCCDDCAKPGATPCGSSGAGMHGATTFTYPTGLVLHDAQSSGVRSGRSLRELPIGRLQMDELVRIPLTTGCSVPFTAAQRTCLQDARDAAIAVGHAAWAHVIERNHHSDVFAAYQAYVAAWSSEWTMRLGACQPLFSTLATVGPTSVFVQVQNALKTPVPLDDGSGHALMASYFGYGGIPLSWFDPSCIPVTPGYVPVQHTAPMRRILPRCRDVDCSHPEHFTEAEALEIKALLDIIIRSLGHPDAAAVCAEFSEVVSTASPGLYSRFATRSNCDVCQILLAAAGGVVTGVGGAPEYYFSPSFLPTGGFDYCRCSDPGIPVPC